MKAALALVALGSCAGVAGQAIAPYLEDTKHGRCVTGGYAMTASSTTVTTLVSTCLSTGAIDAGPQAIDAGAPSADARQLETE